MMYPFLTLDDQTEIVHSQLLDDGSVKVYVEKLQAELSDTMAMCGAHSLADISRSPQPLKFPRFYMPKPPCRVFFYCSTLSGCFKAA